MKTARFLSGARVYGIRAANLGNGAFDTWFFFKDYSNAEYCFPTRKIYRLRANRLNPNSHIN